ncbi:MAG: hypothetical protein D0531_04765, partial [Methylococcales bacterium]
MANISKVTHCITRLHKNNIKP